MVHECPYCGPVPNFLLYEGDYGARLTCYGCSSVFADHMSVLRAKHGEKEDASSIPPGN
jgi:hypothetical protein